jgi:hypothetical protein
MVHDQEQNGCSKSLSSSLDIAPHSFISKDKIKAQGKEI